MRFFTSTQGSLKVASIGKQITCVVTLLGVLFLPASLYSETESAVKAAFIYNFGVLVKWPSSKFTNAEDPMVIGIVGRDPFEGGLGSAPNSRKIGSHPLQVKNVRITDPDTMRGCCILFVAETDYLPNVIASVKGSPVLLVGEDEDFVSHGGMIGFIVRNHRVKLEINPEAIVQAHLSIPSDLLAIAKIVHKS